MDRAALRTAIDLGIRHGGWCPAGRLAEDGTIPAEFLLDETPSAEYPQRTEFNVRDSSATLLLYSGKLGGGTLLTGKLAERYQRPWLAVDLADSDQAAAVQRVRRWLVDCRPLTLNVAGPRESGCPGIGSRAARFLKRVWCAEVAG